MSEVDLKKLYSNMSDMACASLNLYKKTIDHPCIKGQASEVFWIELLSKYLPTQYGINSGKVIDHRGSTSKQIDIIVYNRESFPYVINDRQTTYIPVEAVVCVFEVKQELKNNINNAADKIESVRKLGRSFLNKNGEEIELESESLYPIIGGVLTTDSSLSRDSLKKQLCNLSGTRTIDIGCCVNAYNFYVKYNFPEELRCNYKSRRNASVLIYDKENALPIFLFQLEHTLQKNTRNASDLIIDIDAYLKVVGADLDNKPIVKALF